MFNNEENIKFDENVFSFDDLYCLKILEIISYELKSMDTISFSYCKWIDLNSFNQWLQRSLYQNKSNLIKSISIIGYKDYKYEVDKIINCKQSHELLKEKIDTQCATTITSFKDLCSINLSIQ